MQAAPHLGLVYSNSVNMEVYDEPIRVVFRPSVKTFVYGAAHGCKGYVILALLEYGLQSVGLV